MASLTQDWSANLIFALLAGTIIADVLTVFTRVNDKNTLIHTSLFYEPQG